MIGLRIIPDTRLNCIFSTCLTNIGLVMDFEGNQIGNFYRQKKRIESFKSLMTNKGRKNDSFQSSTSYLETSLGTDKSCSGSLYEG